MSMPIIVPGTVTRIQAISDLIESVALQETGLSHIINAEGEKIQKVVAAGTIDQMIDINASAKALLNTITHLEMVMQSKLELFSDCLCLPAPCSPLLDTNIQASNATFVVHKNSITDYLIDLGLLVVPGTAGTFTIVTDPVGLPISVNGTLPQGVTLSGNVLTYTNTNFLRTIRLYLGTGACQQVMTINFISETP